MALLTALLVALGSTQPPNLLSNPSFQQGLLTPRYWSLNHSNNNRAIWVRAVGDPNHKAVELTGSGTDWAGASSARVPVQPGERLTVAAWVEVLVPGEARDHLYLRYWKDGAFQGQEGPVVPIQAGLHLVSGTVTVPAGIEQVDVSLQIWSPARMRLRVAGLFRGRSEEMQALLPRPPDEPQGWEEVPIPDHQPGDDDRDGLNDALERQLGIPADARSRRLTRRKTTSFQTPTGYREDNDLKVDIVIVAGNQADSLRSWQAMGYEPHVMAGFRAGTDYVREHPDEVQTTRRGEPIAIDHSYYMVPTARRREIFAHYFQEAVRGGARAVCPEEPEFWARAGYSEAFKREWQAFYGEPWQDPEASVANRYRSERLKAQLQLQLLSDIYRAARETDPQVKRFLLTHSPLNYAYWNIAFAHAAALRTGLIDEVVAQVWSGTASTPVPYAGRRQEMTLAHAFLEYASCVGWLRGRRETLWFLMDPLADSPDWPMEEYLRRYQETLASALLFPSVDHFEVLPWPTRIFGRVPPDFAVRICTAINLLADMQNAAPEETAWRVAGPPGIATVIADSLMWQRAEPDPSDMGAVFGLSLPLLTAGVPLQIAYLDRVADAGYLDGYRLLLLSYEALKPIGHNAHFYLADWVRKGGTLVIFGGEDAYKAVPEWWRRAGFNDPTSHLLAGLGWDTRDRRVTSGLQGEWQEVVRTDYTGRQAENRGLVEIDLTPFLRDADAVLLRLVDTLKEDGWGPSVFRIEAEGQQDGRSVRLEVRPGTPEEQALIAFDDGSQLTPANQRFADGSASITYRFRFDRGTRARARFDLANQYAVLASIVESAQRTFRRVGEAELAAGWEVPPSEPVVVYPRSGARPLYASDGNVLLEEREWGRGKVLYCGLSPSYFARHPEGIERLRALARYAWGGRQPAWNEPGALHLQRGRYHIAAAWEKPLSVTGRCVNLLEADLPVVESAQIPAGGRALLYEARETKGDRPALLYTSCCLEWQKEEENEGRYLLSQALGTDGVCRFFTAGRTPNVRLTDPAGVDQPFDLKLEGDTCRLRFANRPDGVGLVVGWE